jgi:uncharacterized protein
MPLVARIVYARERHVSWLCRAGWRWTVAKVGFEMTVGQGVLLFAIAIVAGALNSVAGGGSFFTFPTLVFTGVPPIQANATNTVALWPGALASIGAYRKELGATPRPTLLLLGGVSLVGGLIGAIVLLHTPKNTFAALIPWLLLAATLLFAFGPRLTALVRARQGEKAGDVGMRPYGTALLQLVISIYGGFFGGGIGILMLAALGFMGMENIHEMNALKAVLNALINGIAVVAFVIAGAVFWAQALVMLVGAIVGGYGGAALARKMDPRHVRWFVIVVGLAMSAYFFVRG